MFDDDIPNIIITYFTAAQCTERKRGQFLLWRAPRYIAPLLQYTAVAGAAVQERLECPNTSWEPGLTKRRLSSMKHQGKRGSKVTMELREHSWLPFLVLFLEWKYSEANVSCPIIYHTTKEATMFVLHVETKEQNQKSCLQLCFSHNFKEFMANLWIRGTLLLPKCNYNGTQIFLKYNKNRTLQFNLEHQKNVLIVHTHWSQWHHKNWLCFGFCIFFLWFQKIAFEDEKLLK